MKNKKNLKIAVVSSKSRYLNKNHNLAHFEKIIERVAVKGARLVCFPELALMGYSLSPEAMVASEKIPGPSTDACCKIAKKYKVYISMGLMERSRGKRYITQFIVGPKGLLGKYRKHFIAQPEAGHGLSAGKESPAVFMIDDFRIGISICYDSNFPVLIKRLKKKNVDLILYPHGNVRWLGRDAEEWSRGKIVRAVPNAIAARAYVAVNNSAGDMKTDSGTMFFGSGALVIDPLGQVVKRTMQKTRSEKMIVCELVKPLSEHIPKREMEGVIKRENFCCEIGAGNFNP